MKLTLDPKNLIFTLYTFGLIVMTSLPSVQYTVPFYFQAIYTICFVGYFFLIFANDYSNFKFYMIIIAFVLGFLYFFVTYPGNVVEAATEIVLVLITMLPAIMFLFAMRSFEGRQKLVIIFFIAIFLFVFLRTYNALIENPLIARVLAQGVETEYLMSFRRLNVGGFSYCYLLMFIIPTSLYIILKVKGMIFKIIAGVTLIAGVTIVFNAQYATLILLTIVITMIMLFKITQNKLVKTVFIIVLIVSIFGLSDILSYISDLTGSELIDNKFNNILGFLTGDIQANDVTSRVSLITDSLSVFIKSPIWGNEYISGGSGFDSHSTFFGMLTTTGILGCAAYYFMHFLSRKLILEFLNEKSKVVWDCLFFGFILLSIFNPISYMYELFVLLYLIIPLILKLFEDSEDIILEFQKNMTVY